MRRHVSDTRITIASLDIDDMPVMIRLLQAGQRPHATKHRLLLAARDSLLIGIIRCKMYVIPPAWPSVSIKIIVNF